jgi:hypothetical protein
VYFAAPAAVRRSSSVIRVCWLLTTDLVLTTVFGSVVVVSHSFSPGLSSRPS